MGGTGGGNLAKGKGARRAFRRSRNRRRRSRCRARPQADCPAGAPSEVKEKFAEKKQINRFPLQQPLTL